MRRPTSHTFGSGRTWLVVNPDRSLSIEATANQDSPLLEGKTPVLGPDLWEHAYFLEYKHRLEYINVFWHVVNWREVAGRYEPGHSWWRSGAAGSRTCRTTGSASGYLSAGETCPVLATFERKVSARSDPRKEGETMARSEIMQKIENFSEEREAFGSRRVPPRGSGRPPEARGNRPLFRCAVGPQAAGAGRRVREAGRGLPGSLRREPGGRRSRRLQVGKVAFPGEGRDETRQIDGISQGPGSR